MYFVYTNDIVLFTPTFIASLIAFGVSLILYIVELQLINYCIGYTLASWRFDDRILYYDLETKDIIKMVQK